MAFTTGATTADCCITISNALPNLAGELDPSSIREDIAVVAALKSDQNEAGLDEIRTQTRSGKTLTVEVPYRIPVCDTPDTDLKDICDYDPAGDSDDLLYASVDVDRAQSMGGKIAGAQFRTLCENAPERLARRLLNAATDIIRAMSDDLYGLMAADVGNYPKSGDASVLATTKTLNLLNENGDINKSAFALMKQQFKLMHTNTSPLMIGGHQFDLARTINDMANQQGGVDFNPNATIAGVNVWSDYKVDDAVEGVSPAVDSYALAWLPGAWRLIEAYDYIGDWEILNQPNVTKTTIQLFGLDFDYVLKFDPYCDEYTWILQKRYDIFSIPEAVYSACFNFNHRLLFKVGCGAFACETGTEL